MNTKKELLNGKTFYYSNEFEYLELEASFYKERYTIYFEGSIIHASKTYKSFVKKLEDTIKKHSLLKGYL